MEDIKTYAYIHRGSEGSKKILCFHCAVKEIVIAEMLRLKHDRIALLPETYELVLEKGATDSSYDMRSTPLCSVCGARIKDFCIG